MATLTERILKLLPHKDIANNGDLYLRRHYLTPRNWPWRLFLHLIVRPDGDRAPHSHPWAWFGGVVAGGYIERVWADPTKPDEFVDVVRRPGRVGWRPAAFTHTITEVFGRTWTLVFASRTEQPWGFYPKGEFVKAEAYLKEMYGINLGVEDGAQVPASLRGED